MGKWKSNIRMYKEFTSGYLKYRRELKKADEWITKYAKLKGYRVNPHKMYLTNLKIWISENQKMYGTRLCPCFEPTGDKATDRKLVCPCAYAAHDIETTGTCHCNLFGRGDLTDEEFVEAEKELMKEYRIPLKLQDYVLDTRGVPQDEYRQMDVPDPVHQVKQALNQITRFPLEVIVEREQSANNLLQFAKLKGLQGEMKQDGDLYKVTLTKCSSPFRDTLFAY